MKFLTLISFLFLSLLNSAQTLDNMREADDLFENKRYASAYTIYNQLIEKDKNNPELHLKIGICYLYSRSLKHKAASHLEKARELGLSGDRLSNPSFAAYASNFNSYLGDAYTISYKFDAAKECYIKQKKLNNASQNIKDPQEMDRKIELCNLGKELKELVALPVKIEHSPTKKNTKSAFDSSSVLTADKKTRIFTIKVPVEKSREYADAKFYETIEISSQDTLKRTEPKVIKVNNGRGPDTTIYATNIGTSVDGQIVLTYRNDKGEGNLFITTLKSNEWSQINKLDKTVNTSGWEPNESLTPDGKILFFASDRKGGFGGKDIYMCKKDADGEWGKAINLGPTVNSPYDDEAPFIHPDGITLYFSSNRTNPDEFYDNYICTYIQENKWSKPVVTGYPVDKGTDNVFYEATAVKNKKLSVSKGYSAKELKQKQEDSVKQAMERENYVISFVNARKKPLTLLKGKVKTSTGEFPPKTKITVTDNLNGEILASYYTNKNGWYSMVLPVDKNNNITYEAEGYLFHSENRLVNTETDYYTQREPIELQPMVKKAETHLSNIFFDSAQTVVNSLSETEINNIAQMMRSKPKMKINIRDEVYTSKQISYSKKFAKERARAVAAKLYTKGIEPERISVSGCKKKSPKVKGKYVRPLEKDLNKLVLTIEKTE